MEQPNTVNDNCVNWFWQGSKWTSIYNLICKKIRTSICIETVRHLPIFPTDLVGGEIIPRAANYIFYLKDFPLISQESQVWNLCDHVWYTLKLVVNCGIKIHILTVNILYLMFLDTVLISVSANIFRTYSPTKSRFIQKKRLLRALYDEYLPRPEMALLVWHISYI